MTTLDAGSTLVTVNGGTLLYKQADGSVRTRTAAGVDTALQAPADAASVIAETWQLSGNNVFAFARKGTDATTTAVYRWKPDGTVSRLVDPSAPAGYTQSGRPFVADYPFVVWGHGAGSTAGSLAVHNLEANTFQYVVSPPTSEGAPDNFSAKRSASTLKVAFDARLKNGWALDWPERDVYVWDSASAATTRITFTSNEANLMPQLAGERVIWRNIHSITGSGFKLLSSALDGTDTRWLSAGLTNNYRMLDAYIAKDGTIAWSEGDLSPSMLKASTDGVTGAIVTTSPGSPLWFIAGAGHVFYNTGGVLYDWSAATGSKPTEAAMFVDEQTLFYVKSGTTQVWKLSLK